MCIAVTCVHLLNSKSCTQPFSLLSSLSRLGMAEWFRVMGLKSGNPPSSHFLDLFLVVPSSIPQPPCVNSQLVRLPPVGILNSYVPFEIFVCLFTVPSVSTTVHLTLT